MSALLPCPHCGSEPWFKGDAGQWQDDNRYVEMSVECCATLTETIGWRKARDMTKVQREAELKTRLTAAWNKREVPEDAPAAPARQPLTDEQIQMLWVSGAVGPFEFARAIERAHGIGGAT